MNFRRLSTKPLRLLGLLCLAAALLALAGGPAGAAAASGSLDRSFGTGGHAIAGIDLTEPELWNELETEVARTVDGRVFVASQVFPGRNVIVAFTRDGQIDRSFGENGRLRLPVVGSQPFSIGAIATDGAGRLLVAGQPTLAGAPEPLVVMRFTPEGALDPALDGDGIVIRELKVRPFPDKEFTAGARALGIAVDGVGRILVAAQAGNVVSGVDSIFSANIVRFHADGRIDPSFGIDGSVVFQASELEEAEGLTPVGGYAPMFRGKALPTRLVPGSGSGPWLYRFTPDGTLDYGFGGAGRVVTGPLLAIAADSRGRVLILNEKGALTRLTATGQVDQSFQRTGTKAMPEDWQPGGIAVTAGGHVLVSGTELHGDDDSPRRWLVLTRVDVGGEVVRGFGRRGVVRTSLGPGSGTMGDHVLLDGRGGAIVAGPVTSQNKPRIPVGLGLFRYHLSR